ANPPPIGYLLPGQFGNIIAYRGANSQKVDWLGKSTCPRRGRMGITGEQEKAMVYEWRCGEYVISTDRERLDLRAVHGFLATASYWAGGITMEVVARSVEHSLPFGVYNTHQQVGFARVITDYATFA